MSVKIKRYIYNTLQFNNKSKITVILNSIIILLIVLSVPIDVIESVNDTSPMVRKIIIHADIYISIIFFIEYLLRIYSCTQDPKYSHPVAGRIKYMFTPLMLIDLLAISPFFLLGAGYLRMLRVFRILMLMRYTNAIQLINVVVEEKKSELFVSMSFILMLWIWSSFLIYRVEHVAQPLIFKNMLDAMWWSVVTFTTIGYGDIYPITYMGKLIAAVTVALGLIIFAVTTAILTAGIIEEIHKAENASRKTIEPPVKKENLPKI